MAKTLTIEFTDEQWALVEAHYPCTDETGNHKNITLEQLTNAVFAIIRSEVTTEIARKAASSADTTF